MEINRENMEEYAHPSSELFEKLRRYLIQLPVVPHAVARQLLQEYDGTELAIYELDTLLDIVRNRVSDDFLDQLEQAEKVGTYSVRCGLSKSDKGSQIELMVLTILQPIDASKGRIIYGISIYRTGDDLYIMPARYG